MSPPGQYSKKIRETSGPAYVSSRADPKILIICLD